LIDENLGDGVASRMILGGTSSVDISIAECRGPMPLGGPGARIEVGASVTGTLRVPEAETVIVGRRDNNCTIIVAEGNTALNIVRYTTAADLARQSERASAAATAVGAASLARSTVVADHRARFSDIPDGLSAECQALMRSATGTSRVLSQIPSGSDFFDAMDNGQKFQLCATFTVAARINQSHTEAVENAREANTNLARNAGFSSLGRFQGACCTIGNQAACGGPGGSSGPRLSPEELEAARNETRAREVAGRNSPLCLAIGNLNWRDVQDVMLTLGLEDVEENWDTASNRISAFPGLTADMWDAVCNTTAPNNVTLANAEVFAACQEEAVALTNALPPKEIVLRTQIDVQMVFTTLPTSDQIMNSPLRDDIQTGIVNVIGEVTFTNGEPDGFTFHGVTVTEVAARRLYESAPRRALSVTANVEADFSVLASSREDALQRKTRLTDPAGASLVMEGIQQSMDGRDESAYTAAGLTKPTNLTVTMPTVDDFSVTEQEPGTGLANGSANGATRGEAVLAVMVALLAGLIALR